MEKFDPAKVDRLIESLLSANENHPPEVDSCPNCLLQVSALESVNIQLLAMTQIRLGILRGHIVCPAELVAVGMVIGYHYAEAHRMEQQFDPPPLETLADCESCMERKGKVRSSDPNDPKHLSQRLCYHCHRMAYLEYHERKRTS